LLGSPRPGFLRALQWAGVSSARNQIWLDQGPNSLGSYGLLQKSCHIHTDPKRTQGSGISEVFPRWRCGSTHRLAALPSCVACGQFSRNIVEMDSHDAKRIQLRRQRRQDGRPIPEVSEPRSASSPGGSGWGRLGDRFGLGRFDDAIGLGDYLRRLSGGNPAVGAVLTAAAHRAAIPSARPVAQPVARIAAVGRGAVEVAPVDITTTPVPTDGMEKPPEPAQRPHRTNAGPAAWAATWIAARLTRRAGLRCTRRTAACPTRGAAVRCT